MSRKLELNTSGGVNLSIDEENKDSNRWLVGTFSDYGIYSPVFDPTDDNLYVNTTGTFTTTAPSLDATNWTIIGSGSHIRNVSVSVNTTTGLVTITVTNTAGVATDHTFQSGHQLYTNATAHTQHREKWNIIGGNVNFRDGTQSGEVRSIADAVNWYLPEIKPGSSADATILDQPGLGGFDTQQWEYVLKGLNGTTDEIVVTQGAGEAPNIISLSQTIKDEVDANTAKTGLNAQQVLDIAASELVTKYIDVSQDVDLDTLEAELKAILDALGHSDIGVITQTLNIPVSTGNVATSNFTRNNVVVDDTTGAITAGTAWTYAGGGELYQLPQLAYHSQIASVNSDDDILVVTIGVVASIKYHASLIKVLEDYIIDKPDPKATYLENYQGQQFTPATNHLDGSTEGITVIAQTAPGSYTKLFTISFGIISAIKDHYDSESRFFIQNDRGIRGYIQHTGTDTIITAALKAAIEANRAAIDINKDKLDKYPGIAAIQNASDGQIISISETNVAGTKASMTFNVSSVNTFSMTDTLLMTVSYPDGSPLTDFFDVEVTVPIGASDTTTTVAETIVTNFNAKTGNANLATFVDGYEGTDGFGYGGYVASSSGNTVTFASINDGEVYNAAIGLYEAQEYYDVGNVTQLAHGTGGPKKEFIITNVLSTAFVDDTAAVTNLRPATGWVTGTRFIPTAAGTTIITAAAIAAQATIEYPAAPVNNSLLGLTGMFNGANNSFFQIRTASDPAVQPTTVFFGNFAAQAGDAFLRQNNGTQLLFLNQADGTNSGTDWATNTLAIMDTMIAAGDTGIQAAGFNTTVTGAFISANCSVARTDRTLVFTANETGDTGGADLSEASDSANNYTTTFVQGADETTTTLTQGVEYIVQTPTTLLNLFTQATITIF